MLDDLGRLFSAYVGPAGGRIFRRRRATEAGVHRRRRPRAGDGHDPLYETGIARLSGPGRRVRGDDQRRFLFKFSRDLDRIEQGKAFQLEPARSPMAGWKLYMLGGITTTPGCLAIGCRFHDALAGPVSPRSAVSSAPTATGIS
jgi:hypothetical protein